MLEVSVVVFLLQGYLTSGREVSLLPRIRNAWCCGLLPAPGEVLSYNFAVIAGLEVCCNAQALVRTLWMSGAYAAFETVVAAAYVFSAHVPLFLYGYCCLQLAPAQFASMLVDILIYVLHVVHLLLGLPRHVLWVSGVMDCL
jgi:hypothetical protein